MACRVARSFRDQTHRALVSCSECGATDLELCSISKTLGPHLCPICAQSMVDCGVAKESTPESVRRLVPS
jgi:uncharacterized ferredoxin-like protein